MRSGRSLKISNHDIVKKMYAFDPRVRGLQKDLNSDALSKVMHFLTFGFLASEIDALEVGVPHTLIVTMTGIA